MREGNCTGDNSDGSLSACQIGSISQSIVACRPEYSVRSSFEDKSFRDLSNILVLHDTDRDIIDCDIRHFLCVKLQEIARHRGDPDLPANWPPAHLVWQLADKAAGLFIFASTACQLIDSPGSLQENLQLLATLDTVHEGREGIDVLYQQVIERAIRRFSFPQYVRQCHSILGTIILLQDPLSLDDLSTVLGFKPHLIRSLLNDLHSVLIVPPPHDKKGVIRTIHASFHDFLTDGARCLDARMMVQPIPQYLEITLCLFRCMMRGLRRNVCEIDRLRLNPEVRDLAERTKRHIGGAVEYACLHWVDYLVYVSSAESVLEEELVDSLQLFVKAKLLCWMEVLSLIGRMNIAEASLAKTITWNSEHVLTFFLSHSFEF